MVRSLLLYYFFFFNDTATTEIYTLSLHDALPISLIGTDDGGDLLLRDQALGLGAALLRIGLVVGENEAEDRKSTRLNSSHSQISYAVFCLKKKNTGIRCELDRKQTPTQAAAGNRR